MIWLGFLLSLGNTLHYESISSIGDKRRDPLARAQSNIERPVAGHTRSHVAY